MKNRFSGRNEGRDKSQEACLRQAGRQEARNKNQDSCWTKKPATDQRLVVPIHYSKISVQHSKLVTLLVFRSSYFQSPFPYLYLMIFPTLSDIRAAHARIQPFIHRTPILTSEAIDAIAGCSIYFKCENFQKVGAFKARGAANAVMKLTPTEREKGVATHSSGNHAAALARAATVAGIPSYIVMPSNAPEIKKKAVKGYGGEIIECEPNLKARESTLEAVVARTGA
uniref:pyridoxal-phosphate dependent enzyme n=1 Tax=Algoriphagus sp. TaxID=1872435 RepID=UPI00404872AF